MKVSLNTVKRYIDFTLPSTDELVSRINAQLGGVEEVIDLVSRYKDAKIVKVIECEKHPNADKLSVCMVDAGTGELVQVVCGANNVYAGMWAVWLPPESTVPATYDDPEPFVLGARELRGLMSNGMLASARELAIGDDHDGIVDITEDDLPEGVELSVGASFADVFGLNDTVIDIENKMFTHRPDLFGQLGVAREVAGIFGEQFVSPEWYVKTPEFDDVTGNLSLEVFNDAPEQAPRFMGVAVSDVDVKPSPLWLQCALVAMGGKPINNIVDVTNFIMLLTAQPVHAYDYDKIRGRRLGVRMAEAGEKLPLLNGKTYTLTSDDIVIADGEGAIGLAGIMGGGNSEVTKDTKNIVLEVANFDMYAVRKSSMRHGLFTDALTRFNKGQSPFQNDYVLGLLVATIKEVTSGELASVVADIGNFNDSCRFVYSDEPRSHLHSHNPLGLTEKFINDRLGLQLDRAEIAALLRNVEFKVNLDDTGLNVHYPFWRTDIDEPEDIVEEVGRLYGYNRLPHELPSRSTKPISVHPLLALARVLRESLTRAGGNEVLTYSFVHERVIEAAEQVESDAYQLSNALSPDLQYYRLSLTPSLLDRIHANIKAGHEEFALFEIGKTHSKAAGLDGDGLPVEPGSVALVYASKKAKKGAAFYRAKATLEFLAGKLGLELEYEALGKQSTEPAAAPFEAKRSAVVSDKRTGLYVGIVGEYKKTVGRDFKLPEYAAGFELSTDALLEATSQTEATYRPLSRFPSVERDVSLKVASDVPYVAVRSALVEALAETRLESSLEPVSIYRPDPSAETTFTFRIQLTSHDRTLVSAEVNEVILAVAGQLRSSIGAEVV